MESIPSEKRLEACVNIIHGQLNRLDCVGSGDLKQYIQRVVEQMNADQLAEMEGSIQAYTRKIRDKIEVLMADYKEQRFYDMINTKEITCEPNFRFPKAISPVEIMPPISKSLYTDEASVNGLEENGHFPDSDLGAGDQGIVYGYATDETKSMMPRAFVIAQRICQMLDDAARRMPCLGVDGKAQVSLKYEGDRSKVHTIIVSVQHAPNAPENMLRELVTQIVFQAVGSADMWDNNSKLLINPSGRFVHGGPAADTGMTGRKLAVDQYGPIAHIGGGALSGKDATKVDRSGAYAARWIARNLVAAKLCRQCEVSIVYAIGVCRPVGLTVNTFGTGKKPDEALAKLVWRVFDLRPAAIIERLKLNKPSYSLISIYGHFGRFDLSLPWEQDDMADRLREAAGHD